MTDPWSPRPPVLLGLLTLALGCLGGGISGCSGSDDDTSPDPTEAVGDDDSSAVVSPTPSGDDDAGTTGTPSGDDDGAGDDDTIAVTPTPGPSYRATIRRTGNGVVHILADDLGSAAFGEGYSFAQDHICILADQVVKIRGERSSFFGPGTDDANENSDFGWLALNVVGYAQDGLSKLSPDVRELISGYVAGYNKYLEEVGPNGLPADCRGATWVRPLTDTDLLSYYLSLALLSSGEALLSSIAVAQPPGVGPTLEAPPLPDFRHQDLGSNGWAIGSERSSNGHGMLAANPHFPWEGELKMFESQMTVPGKLNIYGAALMGSLAVNIGFNEHVAWTHTVSDAPRMTVYKLNIAPGDATRYLYDGKIVEMTSQTYAIDVLQDNGKLAKVTRKLYRSQFGPMVVLAPLFNWTTASAFTFRDANENNLRLMEQFLRMNMAQSMDDFENALQDVGGLPWVNTMATDPEGNALYVDASTVPYLSDESIAGWQTALESDKLTQAAWASGVVLLDGSTSVNEWKVDPDAAAPGLIPYSLAPRLERTDYVANANDSHWLSNVEAPLEGYNALYGPERSPRSPRTRMNLQMLTEVGDDAASGPDGLFTIEELQDTLISNRGMIAELLQDAVAERCAGVTTVDYNDTQVDISAVCAAITAWDGRQNLDSQGGVAWREFVSNFDYATLEDAGTLFKVPFDPDNPVATPNTLAAPPLRDPDPILQALAEATTILKQAGLAPDIKLGDAQYTLKGSESIPIHGGQDWEGLSNVTVYSSGLITTLLPRMPRGTVINSHSDLTDKGYVINYGTSFLMALQYTDDGPQARAFLTYSESSDGASPYYADQTRLFSQKAWRTIRFSEEDIAADPELEVYEVSSD